MGSNIRVPDRHLVWSSLVGIVVEVAYTLALLVTAAVIAVVVGRWLL
ncbi:MAG: hypothetical protein ACM3XN_08275 [Chloroflexota bacterium]